MARIAKIVSDEDPFPTQVSEFVQNKRLIETLTVKNKQLREPIMKVVEERGEESTDGHVWLDLEVPVGEVVALQNMRRVSQKPDTQAIERILRSAGVWERCHPPAPTFREDEVLACMYEGLITPEQVEEMFPTEVSYALMTKKKGRK